MGDIIRFDPFGDYRPGSSAGDITDRGFTGHRHNDYIKLIYMGARFYLPGVGRFISADTIVPDPVNPQSYNRYSYVINRPLTFIDPSGHGWECPDPSDCDPGDSSSSPSGSSSGTSSSGNLPPSEEYCVVYPNRCDYMFSQIRPDGISDGTWNTYITMYFQLLGTPYLLPDGRFDDQYLLSLLIYIEFGGIPSGSRIYEAALEALSHQYRGTNGIGCNGGCTSLGEQLIWLNSMQGWYGKNGAPIDTSECTRCWADAGRVLAGVNDNDEYYAWWWGNPKPDSAMATYIDAGQYDEEPSWANPNQHLDGAFIVVQPIQGGNYGYFLVVSYDQNNACGNYPGPVSCMVLSSKTRANPDK